MTELNGETGKFVAQKVYNEGTNEWDKYDGQIYSGMLTAYKQQTDTTAQDIVTAVTGKVIYVTWMYIQTSGNTDTLSIGDSTTGILLYKGKAALDDKEYGNGRAPILRTTAGQALTLDSSGSTDTFNVTVAYFTKDISP